MDAGSYEKRKNQWYLDVKNTPCARSALLNGIISGGVLGSVYYFRSGVVRRSCDVAMGGFAVISLIMWEVCRYQKAKLRTNIKRTVKILNSTNSENDTAN